METYNATNARQNLLGLIQNVNQSHRPVRISSKNGGAVLLSEDDWRAIEETLYLNAVPGLLESVRESEKEPLSGMPSADDLEW